MIIEVGKSYRTRDGRKVDIADIALGGYKGRIYSVGCIFDGYFTIAGTCTKGWNDETPAPDFDLIAPWEDSQTQIKSESKMDVNVGDRVLVELKVLRRGNETGFYACPVSIDDREWWVPRSDIKSVQPAPPAVGDIVEFAIGLNPCELLAIDGEWLWVKAADPEHGTWRDSVKTSRPGFKILKRAGER